MRFIRDIIQEKRSAPGGGDPGHEAFEAGASRSEPLLLKSPILPDENEGTGATIRSDTNAHLDSSEWDDATEGAATQDEFFEEEEDDHDFYLTGDLDAVRAEAGLEEGEDDEEEQDDDAWQNMMSDVAQQVRGADAGLTEAEEVDYLEASDDHLEDLDDAGDEDDDLHDVQPDAFGKLLFEQDRSFPRKPSVSPFRSAASSSTAKVEPMAQEPAPREPVLREPDLPHPAEDDDPAFGGMTALADALEPDPVTMPSPAIGRGANRSGRVKTRLLGFSASEMEDDDPFAKKSASGSEFPVGWLVVVSEVGRGASFALHDGVSTIGRDAEQTVCLDFGDNSVSRTNHASIAYDAEQNKFYIGHSGKTNLVRLNNVPLLSTEELNSKDLIRLGETTLRFIAFCDGDFGWNMADPKAVRRA
ncbi:FHA domain-containing protein [Sulfitobacter sp. D35]|uniref:FHA domain-containing protein n=1 Tax=Sulfitobacter sp. D35 TaxID=3083252 RepID=UPI00296E7423|nr:FHA domain-containing protein [Sulfitobacter sp. D35]MDW4497159.1 FHA domain-containing protein [Sulfitobacter sp. D35]